MASLNRFFLTILALLVTASPAMALDVSFPENELPSEITMPVLDSNDAVKSRLVKFKGGEVQLGGGFLLDEPFYQNQFVSLMGLYNFNEVWGLGLSYLSPGTGVSDYAKQIQKSTQALDFSRAPHLKSAYILTLHQRFFYGKISWSKNTVTPISMHTLVELAYAAYGSRSLPWVAVGVGQRVFFSKKWGADLDLKAMLRQEINPLSQDISASNTTHLQDGDFSTKTKFGTELQVNAFMLF